MMDIDFVLVDVFSDRPFGGNQLAVIPRAEGLSDDLMQQLAREFNFSETAFVLPPTDPSHTCRVRIFTPGGEVPFAGHPTVGTGAVLASLEPDGGAAFGRFVFEEGIGPVTVDISGESIHLRLSTPRCEVAAEPPPVDAVAAALSLTEADVAECWYGGIGLRFCFVRVRNAATVDRAALDKAAWASGVARGWAANLYLFSREPDEGAHLYARGFAPSVEVEEDAATGSACAGLVGGLAQRSPVSDGEWDLQIDQGVAMGRPSLLHATARKEGGQIVEVSVGGCATIVGAGVIKLAGP
jgi:trans-2,3-dihydro-3-hydroxyanthranilate isomerase